MEDKDDLERRAQALDSREAHVCAREALATATEQRLAQRESFADARELALASRERGDGGPRDELLAQLREANEHLIIETLRADEHAEQADATRNAFEASEQQFLTLANVIPMLAWYSAPDGEVLWYNQRWFEYTGTWPHGHAQSQWELALHPDDLARVVARWRAALAAGVPWEDQFRLRRHDGVFRWFLARALPLRDADGRVTRWFGTSTDIDDQKQNEALADAGNRAKDEFLALLGHELRNPLAPISLALELMEVSSPDVGRRERAVIQRQVEHLVRLVDDLLDVSRITRGKVELRIEQVELAEVVARAVEMTSVAFEQKSHVLIQRVATSGLAVDGDASRLAQVVANLLTNAAKYTKAGGEVSIEGRRRGSSIVLEVRDNGIGISSEMLPRVFEMFVQERQGLDRPQGGLGLGLAIAKNLVEMHDGTLRVHSEGLGRGSVFEVELPAAASAAADACDDASATSPARVAAHAGERRRILVVDDNEDAAGLTAESLAALGHDVRVAYDGPGAIAIARDFVPEVALLDIGLPGMDGYELAARLRELFSPEHPRFIAITGYGEQTARDQSRRAGFDVHLVKPVRIDQLSHEITRVTAHADGVR